MSDTVCILSDTHDNVRVVSCAAALIRKISPMLVVHCGDIGSINVLHELADLPMRYVFGNCDHNRRELSKECSRLGLFDILEELRFEIHGRTFLACHGSEYSIVEEAVESQAFDYVLMGHMHEKYDRREGRTRVINPGALCRAPVFTFAELDPARDLLRFVEVRDPACLVP